MAKSTNQENSEFRPSLRAESRSQNSELHNKRSAISTFSYSFDELKVRQDRIETAMGYKAGEAPGPVGELIREVCESAEDHCEIRGGYRLVEGIDVSRDLSSLSLAGKTFSTGKIISSQMKKASGAAVFVCTAGPGMGEWSSQFFEQGEGLTGYVIDTVASETVETATDRVQSALEKEMREAGLNITNRYSPGYCGWPVNDQHLLFSLLPEEFCGVTLTETALMVPVKSVSGIIGTGADVKKSAYKCQVCDMKDCMYRDREG